MSFSLKMQCICPGLEQARPWLPMHFVVDEECHIHGGSDNATFEAVAKVQEKWNSRKSARSEWEASG